MSRCNGRVFTLYLGQLIEMFGFSLTLFLRYYEACSTFSIIEF